MGGDSCLRFGKAAANTAYPLCCGRAGTEIKRTKKLTESGIGARTAGADGEDEGSFSEPRLRAAFTSLANTAASAERLGGASTLRVPERRRAVTLNGLPCHGSTTLQNVTDHGNKEERPAFGNREDERTEQGVGGHAGIRTRESFVFNVCGSRR